MSRKNLKLNAERIFDEVNGNPVYGGIINAFKELIERTANRQLNDKQRISVSIGDKGNNMPTVFMKTSFRCPIVAINYYDVLGKDGQCFDEPQLHIVSFDRKSGGEILLNLVEIDDVSITENKVGDDFLTYNISFFYKPAKMYYYIELVVR